jgi:hypothetical protein
VREEGGSEPSHVVVLRTLGAPERRRLRKPKPRAVEPSPEPEPVATGSVTVIHATEVPEDAAAAWLSGAGEDELDAALVVVNSVLHAHRLAAADPHVREVSREGALVARLGFGSGDQVADGRWAEAVEVPPGREPRRGRRTAALRPQERLAALLGGRDEALACEDLVLRARADLDGGRDRAAALQVRVALEAALAELEGAAGRVADMPERLAELRERRGAIGDAANRALAGPLPADAVTAVTETVTRLEAALRARSAAGFD